MALGRSTMKWSCEYDRCEPEIATTIDHYSYGNRVMYMKNYGVVLVALVRNHCGTDGDTSKICLFYNTSDLRVLVRMVRDPIFAVKVSSRIAEFENDEFGENLCKAHVDKLNKEWP